MPWWVIALLIVAGGFYGVLIFLAFFQPHVVLFIAAWYAVRGKALPRWVVAYAEDVTRQARARRKSLTPHDGGLS